MKMAAASATSSLRVEGETRVGDGTGETTDTCGGYLGTRRKIGGKKMAGKNIAGETKDEVTGTHVSTHRRQR
jgi:hypothetical protein